VVDQGNVGEKYSIAQWATLMLESGLSVVPITEKWANPGESKPFSFEWRLYQSKLMSKTMAEAVFGEAYGVAIVCGRISGGLTILDFDLPGYYDRWREMCIELQIDVDLFPIEKTINGGYHLYIRSEICEPNQKLAKANIDGKPKTAIETRGEGGLIYCAPTPGYSLVQGSLLNILDVSNEVYAQLLAIARCLCDYPSGIEVSSSSSGRNTVDDRPGTIFNERATWDEILTAAGHRRSKTTNNLTYWTREGKSTGVSMVTGLGKGGQDLMYVHTTNAEPLQGGKSYSKFAAYTELQHSGDFSHSAKAIAQIYGLSHRGSNHKVEKLEGENWTPEFSFTDTGNAHRLAALMDGNYRFCKELGGWLVFDGKCFKRDPSDQAVRSLFITMIQTMGEEADSLPEEAAAKTKKWALKCENRLYIDNAVSVVKALEGIGISHSEFNEDPFLLNVQNGVVDLRNGYLMKHDKKFLMTRLANASFLGLEGNLKEGCPSLMKILDHAFSGSELTAEWLLTYAGYSLTGSVREELFAFLYGEANAGKSKFTEAIEYVMGDYAARLPIQSLIQSHRGSSSIPSEIATLSGTRMVLAVEAPGGAYFDTGLIKSLIGETKIRTRRLYQEWFDMRINFKLWVTGNDRPAIRDWDSAIARRTNIIPFVRPVLSHERDSELASKLIREADAILTLLVRYCLNWQNEGLQPTPEMRACLEEYELESDIVKQFVEEWVKPNPDSCPLFSKVYTHFQRYCDLSGSEIQTKKAFSTRMKKAGCRSEKNSDGQACYPGIEIIEQES
jgi:putative DNA primase/helicase